MSSRFSQMLGGLQSKLDAAVNGQNAPNSYGPQTYGPQHGAHYGQQSYGSQPPYGAAPHNYDPSKQYGPPNPHAPAPYGAPGPYGAPYPAQDPFPQAPLNPHGPPASYGAPAHVPGPSDPPSYSPPPYNSSAPNSHQPPASYNGASNSHQSPAPYNGASNSHQPPAPYNGAPNAHQPPTPYGFPSPHAPSPHGAPTSYSLELQRPTNGAPPKLATIRSGSKGDPTTVHPSSDPNAPTLYSFTTSKSKPHLTMHHSLPSPTHPPAFPLGEAVISMTGTSHLTLRGETMTMKEGGMGDKYTLSAPQGAFRWKKDMAGKITELQDGSKNRVAKLKSGSGKKEKTLELCVACDTQMYEVILLSMVVARTLAKESDNIVFDVIEAILGV